MSLIDPALRVVLTAAHKLLQATWFVRRPRTFGAHALAFTPDRRLILVKLRYARGWRAPGGGRKPQETAEATVLRELHEEIGMTAYASVRLACELEEAVHFKQDLAAVFVVEGVLYQPRWTLEVERVGEFLIEELPADTSVQTRRWIETARPQLPLEDGRHRS